MTIAIDLSLRSTGINVIDDDTLELIDFKIVSNPVYLDKKKKIPGLNDEDLILDNCRQIVQFCDEYQGHTIVIESLSFNAVSSSKDLIAANFWLLRTKLYKYHVMKFVPVTRWRCKLFDKAANKKAKEDYKKDPLKNMVAAALPVDVTKRFNEYIMKYELKKDSIFDLADSYHLAIATIKFGEDW